MFTHSISNLIWKHKILFYCLTSHILRKLNTYSPEKNFLKRESLRTEKEQQPRLTDVVESQEKCVRKRRLRRNVDRCVGNEVSLVLSFNDLHNTRGKNST